MKKLCALCGSRFSPEKEYFVLCSDCSQENYVYGAEELSRAFRAISVLINERLNMQEMKLIADSSAIWKFVEELLSEKDIDTRREWLLREAKKVLKIRGADPE